MNRTAFVISEKKTDYPMLVVDREGKIGEALAKELKNESLVIFVSKKAPQVLENIVHVPFLKKIPTIPDNTYSHIFIIDEKMEIGSELLKAFIKKAKNDNSSLNLVMNLNFASKVFIENLIDAYDKVKVIITGDIFKNDSIYDSQTSINKFILQIKSQGKIAIPGDGTKTTAPVYFDDVINGILETAFGVDEKSRIIYLFPKHKVTFLSLANMFRKNEPNLKIDFGKETTTRQEDLILAENGTYLLGDAYNLEERIKKIEFDNIATTENLEEAKNESKPYGEKKERIYNFKTLFLSLILLVLLPIVATLVFSLTGIGFLYAAKNSIEKNSFSPPRVLISFAAGSFAIAQESSTILMEEGGVLGQQGTLNGLVNNINSGKEISDSLVLLLDASDKIKTILAGKSHNPSSDFSSATVELKSALYTYNKEKQKGLIPQSIINKLSDSINIVSSTIDFWPDIFGFNGQRTYLILFQNNMELRPGGGFIGSYGILSVNKGAITNFNIYDVYDADGQLKGHVEPPYPIRRYLPSLHWYLRDSNFNVDFSKGAIASAVFLNTEMHQAVDGVIGVDLSFVRNILTVVGPVKVTDYNQTVNADNFFQVAQVHTEKDFFPGSTQKKDFLRTFYNSLQTKLSQGKNIPYLSLIQAISQSIYEKHILFAFNKANEQAAFAINGWSSSLVDERQSSNSMINDFIGINEANLGADKDNYYISRKVSQDVVIKADGSIGETLTISFQNSAKTNSVLGGVYKNYLRFILPLNTVVSKIQIDGQDQKIVPAITDPAIYEKTGFIAPDGLEVQKEDQEQNTLYGFLVNVQPQQSRSIRIEYTLPQKISLSLPEISYDLRFFKQPGVDSYPYNFSLNFPSSFKTLDSSSDVATKGNTALLSTQISRDRDISMDLTAK
jgi:hypothetical protein